MEVVEKFEKSKNHVKYRNAFNKANLGGLSVTASNLLMEIAGRVKDKGSETIYFTDAELKREELIGKRSLADLIDALNSVSKSLVKITSTIETPEYFEHATVFEHFRVYKAPDAQYRLEVKVHPNYEFLFNELRDNFTVVQLRDFASLRSTRAKTLYRFLQQYRSTGVCYLSLHDVNIFFAVPENYKDKKKYIKDKILNPATEECAKYFDGLGLKSVKDPHAKGHPVVGYRWDFSVSAKLARGKSVTEKFAHGESVTDKVACYASSPTEKVKRIKKKSKLEQYNDFEQRDYDYKELERQLANLTEEKEND